MKKIFSVFSKGILLALTVYAGFFLIWALLFSSCYDNELVQCGDDLMSQTVKIIYKPVFAAFIK